VPYEELTSVSYEVFSSIFCLIIIYFNQHPEIFSFASFPVDGSINLGNITQVIGIVLLNNCSYRGTQRGPTHQDVQKQYGEVQFKAAAWSHRDGQRIRNNLVANSTQTTWQHEIARLPISILVCRMQIKSVAAAVSRLKTYERTSMASYGSDNKVLTLKVSSASLYLVLCCTGSQSNDWSNGVTFIQQASIIYSNHQQSVI
jgi:hypothetical protein